VETRELGLSGLLGSNNLGVGAGTMLISKGEGIQGWGEGGILKTFKDKLFGAHKKVSKKAWRFKVQKNRWRQFAHESSKTISS
jgi:hypothetical protein